MDIGRYQGDDIRTGGCEKKRHRWKGVFLLQSSIA